MEGVAVVTGGASGIGAACCRALAAEGMRVAVLDLADRADAVAAEVGGRPYSADVSDEAALSACAEKIEAEMGPVSVLVNNAGVLQPPVRPAALDMALWDEVVRVDQRGVWLGCVLFGRRMVERRRGSIVNIASIVSLRAVPLHAYGPAKAAVAAMTANLAAEWGPAGVRVNAVSPGFVETPALRAEVDAGRRDLSLIASTKALGRTVRMDEVAQAVVFLAGDRASAITGVNLPVDCGWLAANGWAAYGGLRGPEGANA
ncbi:MAG: SDR family oxidoreductase [Acetobacteraceae bacterium]|nr:SDR family oxidoreductase [Acetobacteraceae bacterium]